ncbi:type III-B CRISPR module RAMP protein Cmr4 [Suttonella ornithocola]|uniref:CRISPR type III-B/RAMP module RAMP protein Cmr4 n=1 Tax=Suttonella ornithocola TaxID=279832 RepID=A0A380MSK7_9GAMM|nr:type III-B CRISPR module RAMP protein Cmr4 [Suttonella ornithocola]SUO95046.1 CRISPR type III-B/RAMP module RAMP protein Cmr4 [Suttonella ornithocola]
MNTYSFHLQALSALHIGTGQGVGAVDLPIMRARASNLPIVPGSSLKGVLRDTLTIDDKASVALFGAKNDKNNDNASFASAIAIGDAHLLLLPIRSFVGTVAFATCPFILQRYQEDLAIDLTVPSCQQQALVTEQTKLLFENKIALEDLDIDAKTDPIAQQWAEKIASTVYPDKPEWQQALLSRMVILPDDVMSFLADTATEIRTRTRIDEKTRTVKDGALWTEENLPSETILWGLLGVGISRSQAYADKSADEMAALLPKTEIFLQLGGKHTIGRGLCRLLLGNKISR